MLRRLAFLPALLPALLLAASPAAAAGALEIIGAPTSPNGLNARVLGRGPEAAYFNPALLPEVGPSTQAGFFLLINHGDILLGDRPAGSDVPESVYDAQIREADGTTHRLEHRPLPTGALPSARADTLDRDAVAYAAVGVVRPLYRDNLVLGFYALLPIRSFQEQKGFFTDEREQYFSNRLHFELLGDRLSLTTLAVAFGGRVARWLSVGVGADVTIGTVARTAVHVPDAGDQRDVLLNPDIEVESTFAPYFAIAARPARWLRLTTTLHLPSSSETEGENRIRFWNYTYPEGEDAIRQTYRTTLGYEPARVGLGVAALGPPVDRAQRAPAPARPRGSAAAPAAPEAAPEAAAAQEMPPSWELGARAQLTQWSQYRDRHGERPEDLWSSTVSVGLGGAMVLGRRRVAGDVAFTPSPVPDQIGRSNYVDNSRLGAGVSFETPVTLLGAGFGVAVFLQGQLFLARAVQKSAAAPSPVFDELPDNAVDLASGDPIEGAAGLQTNNPGYPGFESRGWMAGVGFALRLPQ